MTTIYYKNRVIENYVHKSFGRADHWNTESEREYNEAMEAYYNYLDSLPFIPCPSPSPEWKDGQTLVEGVDFKKEHQIKPESTGYYIPVNQDWYDNSIYEKRIIAVPLNPQASVEEIIDYSKMPVGDFYVLPYDEMFQVFDSNKGTMFTGSKEQCNEVMGIIKSIVAKPQPIPENKETEGRGKTAERELESYLERINNIMCSSFIIKDYPFSRFEGEKIMDVLNEWATKF